MNKFTDILILFIIRNYKLGSMYFNRIIKCLKAIKIK